MKCEITSSYGPLSFEPTPGASLLSLGPTSGKPPLESPQDIREKLLTPIDYPAVHEIAVPGDRVALALDPDVAGWKSALAEIVRLLGEAGVTTGDTILVPTRPLSAHESAGIPAGVSVSSHNPSDRDQLAYLATTERGTRVYLNRRLVDADVVIPVGHIAPDPALGWRGPWSVIFPDLSDDPRWFSGRGRAGDDSHESALDEALEINWLLGAMFQVGAVAAASAEGAVELVCGELRAVARAGIARHEALWSRALAQRADLAVAAVGVPGQPVGWDQLAAALKSAHGCVRRGGTIALAVHFDGQPAQALQRLAGVENPEDYASALQNAENEPDYEAARALAEALQWARVGMLTNWPEEIVTDLGMIRLDSPKELGALVARHRSSVLIARAEEIHLMVNDEE